MGERTKQRPVASGRVAPSRALEFGLALSALSFVLLASTVNVLTAVLALVGNLFYVIVYTRYLKRSTTQNIVIGGAAGAVPPLVGWAAATGNLTVSALLLFVIVFVWTPPHFWALAILIKDKYAAANVPMLPVVKGDRETARQIVLYSARARRRHPAAVGLGDGRPSLPRVRARRSAPCSSGSPSGCGARRPRGGRWCCSTTPSSISPCSSRRWPSTWWCDGSPRARTQEQPPRLAPLRDLRLLFAGTVAVAFLYLAFD